MARLPSRARGRARTRTDACLSPRRAVGIGFGDTLHSLALGGTSAARLETSGAALRAVGALRDISDLLFADAAGSNGIGRVLRGGRAALRQLRGVAAPEGAVLVGTTR